MIFYSINTTIFILPLKKITIVTKSQLLFIFCLLFGIQIQAQDQIVKSGDEWMYYDDGQLNNNWFKNLDKNSNWKKGITPIGYGDRKVITKISYGSDADKKHIVKYFKKTIVLKNPSDYIAYGFQFKRDDGIAIYLNGEEVFRNNLAGGTITSKTLALHTIDSDEESEVLFTVLEPKDFNVGENTIAVSIHQSSKSSSDCIFDFEMFGYKDSKLLSKLLSTKSQKNNTLETEIRDLSQSMTLQESSLKLDLQKARSENLTYILIIISLFLILSIAANVILLLNFRKKDQQLNQKNESLNEFIRSKEQELMLLNTKLLHNKQYFKEIKADIKGIKNVNDSVIKDITYHIELALESDKEWENLQSHFNAIFSGFYDVLLKKYPSLSEIELRHCMFIKLHLQTKEIARILLIDPRSVQTARYRIKKKMNLNEEVDLRSHLLDIIL